MAHGKAIYESDTRSAGSRRFFPALRGMNPVVQWRYVSGICWKRKNRELFLTMVYRTIYVSGSPSRRAHMQDMSLRSGEVIHYQVVIYGR